MKIRQVPQNITSINSSESDPPEPVSENLRNSVNERMSFNFTESFTDFPQPSALDKMLLPASPQLDPSAVKGNFEKQLVEGNFEKKKQKELKQTEEERTAHIPPPPIMEPS
jgi:hypothetical protein